MPDSAPTLLTAQWLNAHAHDSNLIILDASVEKIVGKEPLLYEQFECIPQAIACDLDGDFHNASNGQPHSMPDAQQFAAAASKLGIDANTHVVIYDNQGLYSAPRAWWMFKSMGHLRVSVLDGGLPEWKRAKRPIAYAHAQPTPLSQASQAARLDEPKMISAAQILESLPAQNLTVIDARSSGRFNGTAPEPREGLRSGHIPGSINIPFAEVMDGFTLKPVDELRTLFQRYELKSDARLVASCGSGLTACIILLAAHLAGFEQLALYDGSWSEWGADEALPIDC